MSFEEMHNYHMAVTEREVINGCLNVKKVKDHVIIYTRIINNINLQNLKRASAFIDIADRKVDQEAVKLLSNYRDELLPKKIIKSIARVRLQCRLVENPVKKVECAWAQLLNLVYS